MEATPYDPMLETYSKSIFKSGAWTSCYYQYGSWHDLHRLSLTFDTVETKVNGSGSDDVGIFTINGIYSTKKQSLSLNKTHILGTDNYAENLGHTVTIQLY